MKKILLASCIICLGFNVWSAGSSPIKEKVLRSFERSFPNVHDGKWIENSNIYEVKFKQNDIITRVAYDEDGNMIRTIRYYFEDQLPLLVLSKVKSEYPNQKIFGVTEEMSGETTKYHITLESPKKWTLINSDERGNLSTEHKYNKG